MEGLLLMRNESKWPGPRKHLNKLTYAVSWMLGGSNLLGLERLLNNLNLAGDQIDCVMHRYCNMKPLMKLSNLRRFMLLFRRRHKQTSLPMKLLRKLTSAGRIMLQFRLQQERLNGLREKQRVSFKGGNG